MKKIFFIALSIILTIESKSMKVRSKAFEHNKVLDKKYTKEGDNIFPGLTIIDAPESTKSFAVIVDDPDAPKGTFVHLVAFNLPENLTEITQADIAKATLGKNDFGNAGYDGPMPPKGHGQHQYFFKVYALNDILILPKGISKQELEDAMRGHILERADIVGLYER